MAVHARLCITRASQGEGGSSGTKEPPSFSLVIDKTILLKSLEN